jgi:hypothetical protein
MIPSQEFFEFWRDYFLTTFDYQSHIWDFPNSWTSERDYSIFTGFCYGSRGAFIVEF